MSLQRKVTSKAFATNRHTNPPSTRVSLPTDTAEHAPNFLSPSTSEPSEVTPLVNKETLLYKHVIFVHTHNGNTLMKVTRQDNESSSETIGTNNFSYIDSQLTSSKREYNISCVQFKGS